MYRSHTDAECTWSPAAAVYRSPCLEVQYLHRRDTGLSDISGSAECRKQGKSSLASDMKGVIASA